MPARERVPLFRALLRHYRNARGMSQLDLSSAAEVSCRHISFLETGRAQPSREMVLRLAGALGLSLRDANALLQAAGLPRAFPESRDAQALPPGIERVISRMLEQQEPYPMIVLNARYDLLRANHSATRIFARFVDDPAALQATSNALHLLFHPRLIRPYLEDWHELARNVLTQLQREALSRPSDDSIPELVRELCAYPGVPADWREPALDLPLSPTLEVGMTRGDLRVRFLTTITVFNAPLDVALEDLRLESYFPVDDATEALCRSLAESAPP
jgi:transcriptional regulator with XRE-family HTH domain